MYDLDSLIAIIALSFIGSVAGLVGGFILIIKKEWAAILGKYAVPFAAGVLLTVALLDLLPEAVEYAGDTSYLIALIALLGAFFFEQFFAGLHHHDDHHSQDKHSVQLIIFGDTIHNFIDGVAIAAAYLTDPTFGVIVAFATFLHEGPHEIADFGVLLSKGWSSVKTSCVNLLSSLSGHCLKI